MLKAITWPRPTSPNKFSTGTAASSNTNVRVDEDLMPIFFLVFFNHYASGLSYYYFLSLLITIATTYAVRATVKEEDVRAKMAEYNKKPKKKSGWMARLEEAQRRQQAALREQQKRAGKKNR